jgi:outer membrane protein OmpA-like peptidoglycan-associated protein
MFPTKPTGFHNCGRDASRRRRTGVAASRLLLATCALLAGLAPACGPKAKPARPVAVSVPPPPSRPMPARNREVVDEFKRRGFDAREVGEGVIVYLPTVYLFEFDSASVDQDARKQLREIATILNDDILAGRRVIVEGHADAIGSQQYNQALSQRRADAVTAELVAGGVVSDRITKRAFGKERPLEPNKMSDGKDNPEGRAKNRRVALIVENPIK